jgi:protoporphyrin/coproporphyrin ferrochelatase
LSNDSKTGVVLLNLGGPESLEAIHDFLVNMLSDPDLVPIPWPMRPLLARRIAKRRSAVVAEHYRAIGGKSPIREQSEAQVAALAKQLGRGFAVKYAFRHSPPDTARVVRELAAQGVKQIVALPAYPHWSQTTTGSALKDIKKACRPHSLDLQATPSFPDGPGYIRALAEEACDLVEENTHVLVSAHGLPQRIVNKGDPYVTEVERTFAALKAQLPEGTACSLAFQSRLGPVEWTRPYLTDEISRLAAAGTSSLLVVPVSFVCENLETLYELDLETAQLAKENGITTFRRAAAPGTHPAFIDELTRLVRRAVKQAGWETTNGG